MTELLNQVTECVRTLSDIEVAQALGDGALDKMLKAILDPAYFKGKRITDLLQEHKNRLTLLALVRHAITNNYSMQANSYNPPVYVSPFFTQWYEDGVMFLEGPQPFLGHFCLLRNGEQFVGVAARDISGEQSSVNREDINFVKIDEARKQAQSLLPTNSEDLNKPVLEFGKLIQNRCNTESAYQELFNRYPWSLGMTYSRIERHKALDNANIPDFCGVRTHDGTRDIVEVKPPFTKVFKKGPELSTSFHEAWSQAERYLDLVRRQRQYLLDKGLRFENPVCLLILGYNLPVEVLQLIQQKERMTNQAIQVRTYNDIQRQMMATVEMIRSLVNPEKTSSENAIANSVLQTNRSSANN